MFSFNSFLGPDWEWENQDGGAGSIGSVVTVVINGIVLVSKLTSGNSFPISYFSINQIFSFVTKQKKLSALPRFLKIKDYSDIVVEEKIHYDDFDKMVQRKIEPVYLSFFKLTTPEKGLLSYRTVLLFIFTIWMRLTFTYNLIDCLNTITLMHKIYHGIWC